MPATLTQARDEIYGAVKDFWDGEATAPATILWDDVSGDRPKSVSSAGDVLPYAKATIRHGHSAQTALSNNGGSHRYTNLGMLIVRLSYPAGKGGTDAAVFGQLLVNALRGTHTTNGAWLRNVRYNELGQKGPWFDADVVADFEYDQVA